MVASNETKSGKCSSARVGQFFRYFVTNKRLFVTNKRLFDWTWQLEMKPNLVIVPQQGLGIFFYISRNFATSHGARCKG